jgi:hypothetical protein
MNQLTAIAPVARWPAWAPPELARSCEHDTVVAYLKFATKEIPHTANSDYLRTAVIILAPAAQNRMNQRTTL